MIIATVIIHTTTQPMKLHDKDGCVVSCLVDSGRQRMMIGGGCGLAIWHDRTKIIRSGTGHSVLWAMRQTISEINLDKQLQDESFFATNLQLTLKDSKLCNMLLKKILASVILVAIVTVGAWVLLKQPSTKDAPANTVSVAASYYPLYEFAKQVGGDKVQVTLMTPAGAEPHEYEPPAKTLAIAQQSDVFIYNGGPFEPWINAFLDSYSRTTIRASQGIALQDHGKDPHFWLDPVLVRQIITTIKDGLATADPANKNYYSARAEAYRGKLAQLDADFRNGLQTCQQQTIIASHAAFSYVAARYGFTVQSIAGLSPDEEPSAARLAELSDVITKNGIRYVFFEHLVSPRLADTIAQETGAQTLVLDPLEGLDNEDQEQGKDYLSVQQQNLAHLRTALACQ